MYGFTTLSPLFSNPDLSTNNVHLENRHVLEKHSLIRKSDTYNFLVLKIPIKSFLNVETFKQYLHNYKDQQLLALIQYGFPLDFDKTIQLHSTAINHRSATLPRPRVFGDNISLQHIY